MFKPPLILDQAIAGSAENDLAENNCSKQKYAGADSRSYMRSLDEAIVENAPKNEKQRCRQRKRHHVIG